jgi:alpha-2-macroglobulin
MGPAPRRPGRRARTLRRPRGHPARLPLLHPGGGGHGRPASRSRGCARRSSSCPYLRSHQGELTVQVDGSLTAATQDALDYLEHYPYECVEQTVSRFLPNVLTWQALEEMGPAGAPELRQKLARWSASALQRLYNQQHYDGGWGWWVSDKSDPYLTAYVLQGMLEAHRAGFVVDANVMDRAPAYLRANLPSVAAVDTSHWRANRLAYQLYVLAEYANRGATGRAGASRAGAGRPPLREAPPAGPLRQATLAVALGLLEPDEPSRVQTLLGDLIRRRHRQRHRHHWEEASPTTGT